MPDAITYVLAHEAGCCPSHPQRLLVPGYSACESCLDAKLSETTTSNAAHLDALHRYRAQRASTPRTMRTETPPQASSGRWFACSEQWVPILGIPFACPACGRHHLMEKGT